jgi:hypothetical protein
MRRAARVDANQPAIVEALRKVGATVQPLHTVGQGCPDLLVGYAGHNHVLELKDGSKPPSRRKLTADELEWHDSWRGRVFVVHDISEALIAIGAQSRD